MAYREMREVVTVGASREEALVRSDSRWVSPVGAHRLCQTGGARVERKPLKDWKVHADASGQRLIPDHTNHEIRAQEHSIHRGLSADENIAFGPTVFRPWPVGSSLPRLRSMDTTESVVSMDEIRIRLAANLRRLRAERGISQERLALEAGVDRTMLSKIERRISNPSIETLLKLANRLRVDLVYLVAPLPEPYTPEHAPIGRLIAPPQASVLVAHEPPPRNADD
jgi:transcriptional regulator with XRE-family HTH domain